MTQDQTNDATGPLQPGTRFGKFEIKKRIGRGGYASVYHAFDTILQRDVAIKVLHRVGGVTDDMLRRGVVEAQLMCQLQHKNIVQVYDANITESGLLYLVMELLVGRTLFQILRHYQRLAVEEACAIAIQIADAVEVAHQRGAIHRDLKPENVFVTEGNVVKVLDFGIAKVVHGAQGHTTRPDAIQGTVLYMSPEQIAGHKVTGRSDIFALGNILFEMLYGKNPCLLKNPDADVLAAAWLQTYEIPPALDSIAPYCPRHLSRIVSQSMSKRADERPATMRELGDALATSRTRFVEETGGELKGRIRDLSGVASSSDGGGFASRPAGKFPWQHGSAPPVAPDTEPQAGPPQSEAQPFPQPVMPAGETRAEPVMAPIPTPIRDPSPIAVQVLRQSQADLAPPARRRRIPLPLMVTFWIISGFGGFAVSVGATKIYLQHKKQVASENARIEPTSVQPSVATGQEDGPSATALAPPSTLADSTTAQPALSAAAPASQSKPLARSALAKPKKLNPSEARLRALEEKLNQGTLGNSSDK